MFIWCLIRENQLNGLEVFKNIFQTEFYVENIMTRSHRSALAKFRCGVAPIRLETGRYEKLPVNERFCPFCLDCIEDECHVILECPVYYDMRVPLLEAVFAIDPSLSTRKLDLLLFILSNEVIVKLSVKTLCQILRNRCDMLYL